VRGRYLKEADGRFLGQPSHNTEIDWSLVMAHGIKPVFPFDITLATFLIPNSAMRTHQLHGCEDYLAAIHSNVLKSHFESVRQLERQYKNTIR
jgi:hypothetical protein